MDSKKKEFLLKEIGQGRDRLRAELLSESVENDPVWRARVFRGLDELLIHYVNTLNKA